MGARIRSFDWSQTAIGPMTNWSPTLRIMVRFLLANRFPLLLWWGPEYISIYNDAYRPVLGAKHPWALGKPMSECWSEISHILKPLIDTPFSGGPATWNEDIELEITRYGLPEETHFTIAYSPVPDEAAANGIGGVLATVIEITEKVVGERRIVILRDLAARTGDARTPLDACAIAAKTLARHAKDVPFALLYLLDADRKQARLAGATGVERGQAISPELISLADEDVARGWHFPTAAAAPIIVDDLPSRFPTVSVERFSDLTQTAAILPINAVSTQETAGFLVIGLNPRLKLDERYHDFLQLVRAQIASAIANAKSYEEERKRSEALAEIDRAKTVFFSNVSHEFRTPLTLMLGHMDDILSRSDVRPDDREGLVTAYRNSLRLLKLVNTLLEFSRIEAGRAEAVFQPTDLAKATAELASVFRSATEKAGLNLVVDAPPLPELAYVDREMWEKVVLNLLSNAFKFTFQGEIEVKLGMEQDSFVLTVRDTGIGIPHDEMPRLFERFHRVEGAKGRTQEGSGIGLALVQELVRLHGGSVSAESQLGKGTTFRISIPGGSSHLPSEQIDDAKDRVSTDVSATSFIEEALRWLPESSDKNGGVAEVELDSPIADTRTNGRAFVLVIDDNADMRDYLRRLLGPHYDLEVVGDAEAALAASAHRRPDLVLTDIMIPGMDGLELLKSLRSQSETNTIPIILLSARAGEESRIEGLRAGADDYLVKPFSARELLARVEAHLKLARFRDETAETLRASEERYRAFVTASSDVVYRMSPDWGEMRHLRGKDFIADTERPSQTWLRKYIHPDDQARVIAAIRGAISSKSAFELEHPIIRVDGTIGWTHSRAIPVFDQEGEIIEWFGAARDITESREWDDRQKVLIAELQHRTRNLLAVVRAMVEKTSRASGDLVDFRSRFRERLDALARVQDLLSRLSDQDRVFFDDVIRGEISAMHQGLDRVTLLGPSGVRLSSSTVQTLALALHELATNAVKYGALGQPSGRLAVSWRFEPSGEDGKPWLHIDWQERGVEMPQGGSIARGQGRELIEQALPYQLGARTSYSLEPHGVRCKISVPVSATNEKVGAHV